MVFVVWTSLTTGQRETEGTYVHRKREFLGFNEPGSVYVFPLCFPRTFHGESQPESQNIHMETLCPSRPRETESDEDPPVDLKGKRFSWFLRIVAESQDE